MSAHFGPDVGVRTSLTSLPGTLRRHLSSIPDPGMFLPSGGSPGGGCSSRSR